MVPAPAHGGTVDARAHEIGVSPDDLTDFSANINPLGLPAGVAAAIIDNIPRLTHYPEPWSESLVAALTAHHRLAPGCVIAGNGSTELIYLLMRQLRPRRVLVVAPAFSEYERAASIAGADTVYWHTTSENDFLPLPAELESLDLEHVDLAVIGNPGNPAGTVLPRSRLEVMVEFFRRRKIRFLVDEAFIDFVGDEYSLIGDVERQPGLMVLRSLTKIFALAGLRCGYLAAASDLVEHVRAGLEPWSVNRLAAVAARTALADAGFIAATRRHIDGERARMAHSIGSRHGWHCFPSRVNYLLLRLPEGGPGGTELAERLFKRHRLLIRRCDNYVGLDDSYIRVAVKGTVANDRLLKALEAVSI
ncbi:MAG: threonine-phosphate decarboxylase [Deltaproteobacteria bacterium]|nr:threonine-phosphate decarboxylase [Candidatus Anaeroferrophillacea bacterium]